MLELCKKQWCNPILISFTEAGKKAQWENLRGYHWGLRLYTIGKDPGLTFKIKLLKTPPQYPKVAIGPNPILHQPSKNQIGKTQAKTFPTSWTPSAITGRTPFQPTLPAGPPSSADLILSMINASIEAIHQTNIIDFQECWVCYSPRPPFYEGLALSLEVITTNDPNALRWQHPEGVGLTVTQVSGIGSAYWDLLCFPWWPYKKLAILLLL